LLVLACGWLALCLVTTTGHLNLPAVLRGFPA
jgi:hypothetical protein